jgi:hypothetical protein
MLYVRKMVDARNFRKKIEEVNKSERDASRSLGAVVKIQSWWRMCRLAKTGPFAFAAKRRFDRRTRAAENLQAKPRSPPGSNPYPRPPAPTAPPWQRPIPELTATRGARSACTAATSHGARHTSPTSSGSASAATGPRCACSASSAVHLALRQHLALRHCCRAWLRSSLCGAVLG